MQTVTDLRQFFSLVIMQLPQSSAAVQYIEGKGVHCVGEVARSVVVNILSVES